MVLQVKSNEHFMKEALKLAQKAFDEGEIPVGALVVWNNRIIAKGFNQTQKLNDSTAHAEMLALTAAFHELGSKYLPDCTLYVTLEPCPMCAGAAYWAQLGKLVFGTPDPKRGYQTISNKLLHPGTEVISGIMEEDCRKIMASFFKELRDQ